MCWKNSTEYTKVKEAERAAILDVCVFNCYQFVGEGGGRETRGPDIICLFIFSKQNKTKNPDILKALTRL